MTESWQSILARAAENLSIELDQIATPAFSHAQAASFASARLSPQLSFAESRERLAKELQAFPVHTRTPRRAKPRIETSTALAVPVTSEKRGQSVPTPRKRTAFQNGMAALLSAVITGGLTAYILLAQGGSGHEGEAAFTAYENQEFHAATEDGNPVFPRGAVAMNRATEDSLMERASYQLTHGDAQDGRAVYEVLADHGSLRGAFALAETYDPEAQAQHPDWGFKPDIRLARAWYKRASELGSLSAYQRLRDLDERATVPQTAAR